MIITILTLFPEVFKDIFSSSIIGRAQKKNRVTIRLVNIRDYAFDKHKSVDDKPYGGGVGMLMRVDVVAKAIEKAKAIKTPPRWPEGTPRTVEESKSKFKEKVILLDPTGELFNQATARRFSRLDHLILVCGHYEGIDERISHFVNDRISIGEYILTGGEIPAMVITDTIIRLLPGTLSSRQETIDESFTKKGVLEAPQYTRPEIFAGFKVPEVLLSGNHQAINQWRVGQSQLRSRRK